MDGQVIGKVDGLDSFETFAKMRLHSKWVLNSERSKPEVEYVIGIRLSHRTLFLSAGRNAEHALHTR